MRCVFNLLLLASVLLTACGKELPLPAKTPARIVMIGELIAGDSLQLRAGRSRPFAAGNQMTPEFERDMQISVGSAGGAHAMTQYEDDLLFSVFTTLFTNPATVRPQTEYQVKASAPGLDPVEATVSVPSAFSGSAEARGVVIQNGDSMYAFDLSLSSLPQGSRYVIEVLGSPVDISGSFFYDNLFRDLETERQLYDSLIRAGERVDVTWDTSYSPLRERQSFLADRNSAENTAPGASRSYYWFFLRPEGQSALRLRIFIPVAAARKGQNQNRQFHIRMKAVAADYYEFLKAYELGSLQAAPNGDVTIKPSAGNSNVKGGFGVVGGVYLQEAKFVY